MVTPVLYGNHLRKRGLEPEREKLLLTSAGILITIIAQGGVGMKQSLRISSEMKTLADRLSEYIGEHFNAKKNFLECDLRPMLNGTILDDEVFRKLQRYMRGHLGWDLERPDPSCSKIVIRAFRPNEIAAAPRAK